MAQSGFTPISLYFSATGAAVPTAANLVAGELALNTNDGKLYFKNSAGVVTLLAGSTSGPAGGSNTQVQYNNSGVLAGITGATSNGTVLTLVTPVLGAATATSLQGIIGNVTPAAGAFTTVTASTPIGTASGGTGQTSFTSGGVVYASNATTFAASSAFQFNGTELGVGITPIASTPVAIQATGGNTAIRLVGTSSSSTSNAGIYWYDSNNTTFNGYIGNFSTGFDFYNQRNTPIVFSTNAAEQMRLTSTGLGIGTTSPAAKLDVVGAISVTGTITSGVTVDAVLQSTNTSTSRKYIEIGNTSGNMTVGVESSAGGALVVGTAAYSAVVGTALAKSLHLFTNNTARLTIDSSGNVGIGTTSPGERLHVTQSTGSGSVQIGTSSGVNEYQYITYGGGVGGTDYGWQVGRSSNTSGIGGNGALYFYDIKAAANRMSIDTAGNLGLGVTPSAWTSNRLAYQNSSSAFWTVPSNPDLCFLSANFYDDGAAKYIANGYASYYRQGTGEHSWYTAPNNTSGAGAPATLTQVLAVDKDKSLALQGATAQTGTGITFPATQNASSNANTLDDYEEGTWTGTLTASTAPTTPPTATGTYTKIGRVVTVSITFEAVNTTGGSGTMYIAGLPFTVGAQGNGTVAYYGMSFSGDYAVSYAGSGANEIYFRGITSNAAWSDTTITAGATKYLQTTITYTV